MAVQRPLRIGVIAPPWLSVPPTAYGGTELAVDVLCRGLSQRGHQVDLFTLGSSTCAVDRQWLFDVADPDHMGFTIPELRHVSAAYDTFSDHDIIHDHTVAGPLVARLHPEVPVVATCHSAFDEDFTDLYRRAAGHVLVVAVSHDHAARAAPHLSVGEVIHHGIDLNRYRFGSGDKGYLLALARMSPDKGIDVAIDVARRTGNDLLIAAKMRKPAEKRYFDKVIEPLLGNGVTYVGEVDHERKVRLLAGARAVVNPMQWDEPFGLVMIESLACGTPVVATRRGAGPEIIQDGLVGYLGDDVEALVRGVERIDAIDRQACRDHVAQRFSMARMAADHEALYRKVLEAGSPAHLAWPARFPKKAGPKKERPDAQSMINSMSSSSPATATV